jgi:hypothetical protein
MRANASAAVARHGVVRSRTNATLTPPLTLHEALLHIHVYVGGLGGLEFTLQALQVVLAPSIVHRDARLL